MTISDSQQVTQAANQCGVRVTLVQSGINRVNAKVGTRVYSSRTSAITAISKLYMK